MAFTPTETKRIEAIESAINTLQTASNNLATRKEIKNLFAILDQLIRTLQTDVAQMELTGSGGALASHKIDPEAHSQLDARYYPKDEFTATSTGINDAGKPVLLSASGVLDSTLLPGSAGNDHGSLGGLSDDDHTQYYNAARLAADPLVQSGLSTSHSRSHEMDSVADHAAAFEANWGKYVRANPSDGKIEFVELDISSDHGELTGLSDDDHTIYLKADGTRPLSAAWAANSRIYNSGAALNLGSNAATSHSLGTNDVLIGGKLEVNGVIYGDNDIECSSLVEITGTAWWLNGGSTPTWSFRSNLELRWASGTSYGGSKDVGLLRDAAGRLRVSDGSTGYGGIRVSSIISRASGAASMSEQHGEGASATGANSLAVGGNATASAQHGTALGSETDAAEQGTAVGYGAQATIQCIALGYGANASSNTYGTAVGISASAQAPNSIAIGRGAGVGFTNATDAIVIGRNSSIPSTGGYGSVVIGPLLTVTADEVIHISASAQGSRSVAAAGATIVGEINANLTNAATGFVGIGNALNVGAGNFTNATVVGHSATVSAGSSTAIGQAAVCSSTNTVALGTDAQASAASSNSIGSLSRASGIGSVAIGVSAEVTSFRGIALGYNSDVRGEDSIAIGDNAVTSTYTNALAIGENATATANNEGVIGSSGQNINLKVFGTLRATGQIAPTTVTTSTPSGTTQTIDLNTGNVQVLSLASATGNVDLTIDNPLVGGSYVIKIIQHGSAPVDVVWPATVLWSGGTAPVISTGASAIDIISLIWDGTNFYGSFVQDFS